MPSIESRMVPDTVQLIVDVAGLCSCAPAFEVIRPAGIAPRRNAQRKRSYQCSRNSFVCSTSAIARATRLYVSSIVWSMTSPVLDFSRYFLSQMSSDASCIAMSFESVPIVSTCTLLINFSV